MCADCGCGVSEEGKTPHYVPLAQSSSRVKVMRGLLSENERAAGHNRRHFDLHQTLAINLMSSPGAGKTALLEASIEALSATYRIAVIVGDLETDNDARRIRARGVPAVQITTGSACHLDASMVHDAWNQLRHEPVDLLFIENVGNLVCPASFALGQHADVVLLSVPEGDDKPAKYPVMFRSADLMLITKSDLLPYLSDFVPLRARRYMGEIGNPAPVLAMSSRDGTGMDEWFGWLRRMHAAQGRPAGAAP